MGRGIYIDLSGIDRNDFRVSEREHAVAGKVFLITPGFDKHLWERDELYLRSLIVAEDGEIICSGFPKFRNYGEDSEDDRITRRLIAEGKALFPEKMDGSLIIRSVIDGVVCMRTRGSHHLGDFQDQIMEMVEEKYPSLLDPKLVSDMTLLFEYTSPDNQIILEYEDSRLTTLGAMVYDHDSGLPTYVGNKGLVDNIAGIFGVDKVKFHDLPNDLDEVSKMVSLWSDSEGIVIWGQLEDRMHLAKIKAAEYIRFHSLKYQLSGDKIKRLCWMKGIETVDELREEMYRLGIDWEFLSFILDDFNEYCDRLTYMRERIKVVTEVIHREGIDKLPSMKRKAVTLKRLFSDKRDFSIGIQYCRGNHDYLDKIIYAYALEVPINTLNNLKEALEENYKKYGF